MCSACVNVDILVHVTRRLVHAQSKKKRSALGHFPTQNTGLINQTWCNYLAICDSYFLLKNSFLHTYFSTVMLLVHTQNSQSIFHKAEQISHWLTISLRNVN